MKAARQRTAMPQRGKHSGQIVGFYLDGSSPFPPGLGEYSDYQNGIHYALALILWRVW
jgi:hypothetical protein